MLKEIIANKKLEMQVQKNTLNLAEIKQKAILADGSFLRALRKPGLNIIAEIKPKSPSVGQLRNDLNVDEILGFYNKYASAISVLTDEKFFGGSFALLSEISEKSHLPTLCKDFILDPLQCYLARSHGAQAVLLIVKILEQKELENLYEQINELGMKAVIEVQNKIELERAMALKPAPEIILINNRDLDTFKISFDTTKELRSLIKGQTIVISASGIQSKTDIEELMPFCTNFLVGSHFMRSNNIENEFRSLTDANLLPSSAIKKGKNK